MASLLVATCRKRCHSGTLASCTAHVQHHFAQRLAALRMRRWVGGNYRSSHSSHQNVKFAPKDWSSGGRLEQEIPLLAQDHMVQYEAHLAQLAHLIRRVGTFRSR
jgi:hypothetical protein